MRISEIRASVDKWARIVSVTPEEYNELLGELGFQTKEVSGSTGKRSWNVTAKGSRHTRMSKNPFKKELLWDFDAHYEVHKLLGKRTQRYLFCEKCDTYLNVQPGFDFRLKKFTCLRCGHVNSLRYQVEEEAAPTTYIFHKCTECKKTASDIDAVNVLFGFSMTENGITPHNVCKECRNKWKTEL